MKYRQQAGFTIVELITIIVVIGILAGVGIFGYMGITRDTRDTQRRADAEVIAVALGSWARDNDRAPTQIEGGDGGNGEGWLRSTGYSSNIESVLIDEEYLDRQIQAPGAPDNTNGYSFFACNTGSSSEPRYGVFMTLESVGESDQSIVDEWQSGCTSAPFNAPYNANAVRIFTFRQ